MATQIQETRYQGTGDKFYMEVDRIKELLTRAVSKEELEELYSLLQAHNETTLLMKKCIAGFIRHKK